MQLGSIRDPTVVSGGTDNNICVWDLRFSDKGPRLTLCGHTDNINSLKWDWTKIVSGGQDCTVRIWDINSGICLKSADIHEEPVSKILFNDTQIISSSWDGQVKTMSKSKVL